MTDLTKPVKHGTAIEWTHGAGYTGETWNPAVGCSKVSTGCLHCYAEQVHKMRHNGIHGYPVWQPWTALNAEHNVTLLPERLTQPLRWQKPRMIFVCSMSDLFHEQIPDDYIAQVFAVMALSPQHVFQVLTKRPDRMREWMTWASSHLNRWGDVAVPSLNRCGHVRNHVDWMLPNLKPARDPMARLFDWPLRNVWCGTSIENRKWVGRADELRATPAAVRFISAEPLVGPLVHEEGCLDDDDRSYWYDGYTGPQLDLTGIDWLIVGGESGPRHRPIQESWVRDLLAICEHNTWDWDGHLNGHTRLFLKQWGGRTPKAGGRELDGRELNDMPTPLQIGAGS